MATPIDPAIIDVDFSKQPEYTMGNLGSGDVRRMRSFGEVCRLVPESDWKAEAEKLVATSTGCSAMVTRIYDQKQEGSCVANASCQAMEIVQGVQFGKDRVVHLSAISLYKRIGSSAQSGAYVGDGLEELAKRGALPLDTPENRERFGEKVMPNTGFREPYPQDWENTANYFTALEWLEIKTLADLVSSLLTRFPVVVGREGHSICYCDYLPDGKVKYANSWGNWGENGFGYDTTNQVRKTISGGAWALRAVKTPEFQGAA